MSKLNQNTQYGFIQGALLIGIALLAVVIGALAMASNSNTTDTSKEKLKVNVAVIEKQAADISEAAMIVSAVKGKALASVQITDLQSVPRPPLYLKPAEVSESDYHWQIHPNATVSGSQAVVAILPITEEACTLLNDGSSCGSL